MAENNQIEKVGTHLEMTWQQLKTNFPPSLPHYKELERKTIQKFVELQILPGKYTFDFRLPYELSQKELQTTPQEQRMFKYLKSMRIDVVVETPKEIWIIEVAKSLQLSYTGKILGYTDLYKEIYKPTLPVRMAVVATEDKPQARRALEHMNVKIWMVTI